ncbi:MAG: glutamate racemase [Ideonella sp.]
MSRPAPLQTMQPAAGGIGIFDSGLGGLSVLRALRHLLPATPMTYVADSAYAPYGERSDAEISQRTMAIANTLIGAGCRLIVVACNTATAAAIALLRERWPDTPLVGVEPGVKPALRVSRSGRIGVMATAGTLRSARFHRLIDREVAAAERLLQRPISLHLQACPGLAAAIETADLDSAELQALVSRHCKPLRQSEVDTVVLGCTHYPFVATLIQQQIGSAVQLVDTADAVARQASVRWAGSGLAEATPSGIQMETAPANTRYFSSGDIERLRHAVSHWLGDATPDVRKLPAPG